MMMPRLMTCLCLFVCATAVTARAEEVDPRTLFASGTASSAPKILDHPYVPGELLVRFHSEVDVEDVRQLTKDLGVNEVDRRLMKGLFLLRVSERVRLEDLIATLQQDPRVIDATPNYLGSGGFVPNDTIYPSQWQWESSLGNDIDASAAWDITRGSASTLIAILDSGIAFDHPEFSGRTYFNPAEFPPNGLDDDGNGLIDDYRGWDFFNSDNNPTDDEGHGTWVAMVAAANSNNSFSGAGVDHFARILPLKVLDEDNNGDLVALVDALSYVAQRSDVHIVNLSLQGYAIIPILDDAIAAAAEHSLIIGCAGNFGPDTADGHNPAAHPATTTVGATNVIDMIAGFSSTGDSLEVVAPGVAVTAGDNEFPYEDDAIFGIDGCSFATPIVAGVTALLRSIGPGLTQAELHAILAASSKDLGLPGWDPTYGWGRVNAADALTHALSVWVFRDGFESGSASQWSNTVP